MSVWVIAHRQAPELGQDMQLKGAEPATRDTVVLQLGFAALEGVPSHLGEEVQVPRRLALEPLTFLDRVLVLAHELPLRIRGLTGLLEADLRE